MSLEEKLEWLRQGGYIERGADGRWTLTELGRYISGRLEPPPEGEEGHHLSDVAPHGLR